MTVFPAKEARSSWCRAFPMFAEKRQLHPIDRSVMIGFDAANLTHESGT
jgi:hypothetical protein